MDAQFWDQQYSSHDQLFSGNPNPALIDETAGLPPGQALDVGCGEGADAFWLARRGWKVTAVDVSQVALERAAAQATDTTDAVAWARADLTATGPPAGAFDLVSAQYFPLPKQPGHAALRRLLAALAPGGTLLFVGHDVTDMPPDNDHGFDPGEYYQPHEVAERLDDDWRVLVNETRPRPAPTADNPHTHDTVLRAQRLR